LHFILTPFQTKIQRYASLAQKINADFLCDEGLAPLCLGVLILHLENPLLENREEQELGSDIERDLSEVSLRFIGLCQWSLTVLALWVHWRDEALQSVLVPHPGSQSRHPDQEIPRDPFRLQLRVQDNFGESLLVSLLCLNSTGGGEPQAREHGAISIFQEDACRRARLLCCEALERKK
jgi:hypothetical protein